MTEAWRRGHDRGRRGRGYYRGVSMTERCGHDRGVGIIEVWA
ncbi:hypothetical protein Hamer_G004693 [Homarus americanus]|uniref:Uncharacterized protein n=1 Tax=Homarus americanus TaxID=6706 RepID=A0A8J5K4V2_HOMAM|nr:hypothetical protein Hamer_G004693 [Homarus americanus]